MRRKQPQDLRQTAFKEETTANSKTLRRELGTKDGSRRVNVAGKASVGGASKTGEQGWVTHGLGVAKKSKCGFSLIAF